MNLKIRNLPVIAFFCRTSTWLLFIATAASNWLVLTQHKFSLFGVWEFDEMRGGWWRSRTPFEAEGAILYVLPFSLAVLMTALLYLHLRYRKTIDLDAVTGRDVEDWNALNPFQRRVLATATFIGVLIALCILCSSLARGVEPVDQVARWSQAAINPKYSLALDVELGRYRRNLSRYQAIEAMRPNGVPAEVLDCLHYRESSGSFNCHAHEGSSLLHRTRDEPKGRPLHPEPPYTFEQSAEDAYYVCEHPPLDKINWRSMQAALDKMESFNGYGYRRKGIPAPYLWSGTSIYHGGKYVRDGVFSATAMDQQLGCAAILKWFERNGVRVAFLSGQDPAFRLTPPAIR